MRLHYKLLLVSSINRVTAESSGNLASRQISEAMLLWVCLALGMHGNCLGTLDAVVMKELAIDCCINDPGFVGSCNPAPTFAF